MHADHSTPQIRAARPPPDHVSTATCAPLRTTASALDSCMPWAFQVHDCRMPSGAAHGSPTDCIPQHTAAPSEIGAVDWTQLVLCALM